MAKRRRFSSEPFGAAIERLMNRRIESRVVDGFRASSNLPGPDKSSLRPALARKAA